MADREGYLCPTNTTDLPSAKADKRQPGLIQEFSTPQYFSLPDRRDAGYLAASSGGGAIVYYKLRARDDGAGPPPVYRVWVSTDSTSTPPAPSPIGAWVDKTIIAKWSQ
jgi:hypothetical protein